MKNTGEAVKLLENPKMQSPGIGPIYQSDSCDTKAYILDTVSHATYLYRAEQQAGVIAQFFKSSYTY